MLVTVGGQGRTEDEHRNLSHASGFGLARIIPTASPLSLIEGVPLGARSGTP
jgi:hypothetical protein